MRAMLARRVRAWGLSSSRHFVTLHLNRRRCVAMKSVERAHTHYPLRRGHDIMGFAASPSRSLALCLLLLLFSASPARGQQGWTDSGARLSPAGEHANQLRLEMDLLGNTFAVWTTRGATPN